MYLDFGIRLPSLVFQQNFSHFEAKVEATGSQCIRGGTHTTCEARPGDTVIIAGGCGVYCNNWLWLFCLAVYTSGKNTLSVYRTRWTSPGWRLSQFPTLDPLLMRQRILHLHPIRSSRQKGSDTSVWEFSINRDMKGRLLGWHKNR